MSTNKCCYILAYTIRCEVANKYFSILRIYTLDMAIGYTKSCATIDCNISLDGPMAIQISIADIKRPAKYCKPTLPPRVKLVGRTYVIFINQLLIKYALVLMPHVIILRTVYTSNSFFKQK